MDNTNQMVSLYGTLFTVFIILAIAFLAAAALMFFRFDIRGIWGMRSGKAAMRTIKELEELNARSGRLGRPDRRNISYTEEINVEGAAMTGATPVALAAPDIAQTEVLGSGQALPGDETPSPGGFRIARSIVMAHSSEII